MTDASEWFRNNTMSRDLFTLCAGKLLGEGIHRVVHRCGWDERLVVKFETNTGEFANINEWKLWEASDGTNLRKWLAPCEMISDHGNILVQHYCEDIPKSRLPKRAPAVLTDLSIRNWGLYKGRPVVRDYAINLAISDAVYRNKMKIIRANGW